MQNNVGQPRFFVNVFEWLAELNIASIDDVFRTLPVSHWGDDRGDMYWAPGSRIFTARSFFAVLGHREGAENFIVDFVANSLTNTIGVNAEPDLSAIHPDYDGFSIRSFNGYSGFRTDGDWSFWCSTSPGPYPMSVILGTYFDMPISPNLSLTLIREYGGTGELMTNNGSTYSNTLWHKAPMWGDLGAWELRYPPDETYYPSPDGNHRSTFETDQALSKSGRRAWNLTFSYMDDVDLWGVVQTLSGETGFTQAELQNAGYQVDYMGPDGSFYPWNRFTEHENFFSQVWHKTIGGTIPFIFQPDKNNSNPDQFAICKIKSNSLKATQSAVNVYDVSLVIEEVW